jgi:uncharacterized protein YjiS (DUF1127 family)
MHATSERKRPVPDEHSRPVFAADIERPVANTRREPADNDDRCEEPPSAFVEVDGWARRAQSANGFGDAIIAEYSPVARPSSYALFHDARSTRAYALAEIVSTAMVAIADLTRQAVERARQRRSARASHDALRALDDRSLRDLGLDRSELESIAGEVAGSAERTRMRAHVYSQGLPG